MLDRCKIIIMKYRKRIVRSAGLLTSTAKIFPNVHARYGRLGVLVSTGHPEEVVVVSFFVWVAFNEFCSALLDFEVPAKPTLIST